MDVQEQPKYGTLHSTEMDEFENTESQRNLASNGGNTNAEVWTPFTVMERYIRPTFAEFFGVMCFVFIGSMSSVVGYPGGGDAAAGLIAVALAHGFAIILFVAGFGNTSGGHFNPAITLGIMISQEINLIVGVLYIVFQLLGAIVGAAIVKGVLTDAVYDYINGGATLKGDAYSLGEAVGCEWILTMILVSTVLQSAVDSKPSVLAPMAIGLAVGAGILAGGTVSGASMNPARSFGPAVVSGIWTDHWIYWVGPPIGGITSA
uniref:Aquaporin TIP1-3-like n=1 Tax=Saccoglossus kowalevskii TaxID=10224 RepID=A0ABM0M0D9_SACKO|nr:PREDICTED: aquaporin TIP1-3-like [Saccoglossus kowalevskii]